MIFKVYSLYDTVSGEYLSPTVEQSDAVFRRNLENAMSNKGSLLYTHAADFIGRCIGDFDSETGEIHPCPPVTVVNCFSLRGDDDE